MPRAPLAVGTWGTITRSKAPQGYWIARARFRDFDGITRKVSARGKSGAEAERRLRKSLGERATPTREDIRADTRLSVVAAVWLADVEASGRAINTKRRYAEVVALHITPGVGQLRVREATVAALERFIKELFERVGPATAKLARTCLSGIMGTAARHGAAPRNVVRDVSTPAPRRPPVRALTVDEARRFRGALRADRKAMRADVPDVVDMMLGTGARIGEVLAIRWTEVDLLAEVPHVVITGTVVRETGVGLIRQEHTKTQTGRRRLALPRFVVGVLLERQVRADDDALFVFPSSVGTLRDPTNFRDQFRAARDRAGFGWVTPHTLRKTVATLLAEGGLGDLRLAAQQLGHGDDTTTARFYVARTGTAPDSRTVLDTFGD